MEQEILKLVKEGKSVTEISEKLNISKYMIKNTIDSSLYKDEILFLRSLNKAKMIDKDYVDEIVSLMNQKFSLIEIALFLNTTENEIRSLLNYVYTREYSPYYNSSYYNSLFSRYENNLKLNRYLIYQRLEKLESANPLLKLEDYSNSKLISEYRSYQNGKKMVYYYLNNDCKPTNEELSTMFNIPLKTVNIILSNHHHLINLNNFLNTETIQL